MSTFKIQEERPRLPFLRPWRWSGSIFITETEFKWLNFCILLAIEVEQRRQKPIKFVYWSASAKKEKIILLKLQVQKFMAFLKQKKTLEIKAFSIMILKSEILRGVTLIIFFSSKLFQGSSVWMICVQMKINILNERKGLTSLVSTTYAHPKYATEFQEVFLKFDVFSNALNINRKSYEGNQIRSRNNTNKKVPCKYYRWLSSEHYGLQSGFCIIHSHARI